MSFEDVEAARRLRGPRDDRNIPTGTGGFMGESTERDFSKDAGPEQFRVGSAHALERGRNRIDG
jgi:hypothetical protein